MVTGTGGRDASCAGASFISTRDIPTLKDARILLVNAISPKIILERSRRAKDNLVCVRGASPRRVRSANLRPAVKLPCNAHTAGSGLRHSGPKKIATDNAP